MSILNDLFKNPIIAAIRDLEKIDDLQQKPVKWVFLLKGDILSIKYIVSYLKKMQKKVFIHIDLMEGIGKDEIGVKFIAQEVKADGIITTKSNLVTIAKREGLFTIQRIFIVDSQAKETAEKAIKGVNPDAVEILPGVIAKVTEKICSSVNYPVIVGGLVEEEDEVLEALRRGAVGVSTSAEKLWDFIYNQE
ncbi:glycerol-3-phosphate responsive antiterminator [Caldicellulosiruptor acetigenus]|uniref:glycerol-3-phosphate responsive antiterminator n=1 Tax=Caldicellulosiruptor acetigenus TaxID=301953 RepID=UPI0003F4FA75|nr:glycerol-3-phosphate responsive antiterminator [Caldicellulosiruptor acetigenus]WAM36415.1 glycerol-3-phosphate responsive antiterminator [Caldicellulosiruptor acetigenus]